jgi:hypothetical protein
MALPGMAQKKKATQKNEPVICKVESEAYFPGGNSAWLKYIEKNNRLDSIYQLLPEPVVSWMVFVQFIINRTGAVEVTGITGDTTFHPLFRAELYRLFEQSPRWIPAEQNGRKIKALRQQKIGLETGTERDTTNEKTSFIQEKDSTKTTGKDSIHNCLPVPVAIAPSLIMYSFQKTGSTDNRTEIPAKKEHIHYSKGYLTGRKKNDV